MKIRLTRRAYLALDTRGPRIVLPGTVVEWNKETCPSWAEEVMPEVDSTPVVQEQVAQPAETPWLSKGRKGKQGAGGKVLGDGGEVL